MSVPAVMCTPVPCWVASRVRTSRVGRAHPSTRSCGSASHGPHKGSGGGRGRGLGRFGGANEHAVSAFGEGDGRGQADHSRAGHDCIPGAGFVHALDGTAVRQALAGGGDGQPGAFEQGAALGGVIKGNGVRGQPGIPTRNGEPNDFRSHVLGAPGRIRTCATASGGRCSIP